MSEYKDEVIKLLKDYRYSHLMKMWELSHRLIGAIDGKDNRLMGLGIKDYSLTVFDAVGELAASLEAGWPDDVKHEDRLKKILAELSPDTIKNPYEVVINHTDKGEQKTALALAEKKLARAEKLIAELEVKLKTASDSVWETKS